MNSYILWIFTLSGPRRTGGKPFAACAGPAPRSRREKSCVGWSSDTGETFAVTRGQNTFQDGTFRRTIQDGIVQESGPRVDRDAGRSVRTPAARVRFAGASGQPTRAGSAQATRSAWVLWTSTPSPRVEHLGLRAPPAGRGPAGPPRSPRRPCSPSSPPARPPGRPAAWTTRSSRSSGATARDVTTSNVRSPCRSSARPRTTSTWPAPASATTSSRKVVRRSSGSTRVTRRSGRAIASTSPGSPAPEPMSQTVAPLGHHLAQHRAVEQVPVPQPGRLPRTDQAAHHAVGRQQLGVRAPPAGSRSDANTLPASAGGEGARSCVRSRGSFHVKQA